MGVGGKTRTALDFVSSMGIEYSPWGRRVFGLFITLNWGDGFSDALFDYFAVGSVFWGGGTAAWGGASRNGGGCLT